MEVGLGLGLEIVLRRDLPVEVIRVCGRSFGSSMSPTYRVLPIPGLVPRTGREH